MKSYFFPVFYTVLQIILLMGIGFFMRRLGKWEESFFKGISTFLVKIALPLYLFVRIAPGNIEDLGRAWIFPLASLFIIGVGLLLATAVIKIAGLPKKIERAGIALGGFGNSGYIPLTMTEFIPLSLPVVAEVFGINTPMIFVGAYLLVQSTLLWTIGNFLLVKRQHGYRLRDFFTPPMISIIVSFLCVLIVPEGVFTNKTLPFAHVFGAMEKVGNTVMSLVLIALGSMIGGLKFKEIPLRETVKLVGGVSIVRFLLLPGLFFLAYFTVLRRLNLTPAQLWVLFLETHTPPALNLSVMANHSGVNQDLTASTMLLTYLLYVAVIPFFVVFFFSLPGIGLG